MEHEFSYTSKEINDKLSSIINETLGDIDVNNAFDKTEHITGLSQVQSQKRLNGLDLMIF